MGDALSGSVILGETKCEIGLGIAVLQNPHRVVVDLEKIVLARGVSWHVQRRVLAFKNKTVVFS